jgi:hypothetical protein
MPIVTQCTAPGCETLTMGPLCVDHDLPVTRVFVRGRPFTRKTAAFEWRYTTASRPFTPSLRRASERAVAARSLR